MFRIEYVPLMEGERYVQEYLSLKQTTESVPEITKMFVEKALSYHEYATSEKVQMSWYLSMLKRDIMKFMSTAQYRTL